MKRMILDTEKVNKLLNEKGLKIVWVSKQLGLAQTTGYQLFRDGVVPKFPRLPGRTHAMLKALAKMLNVKMSDLVIRF